MDSVDEGCMGGLSSGFHGEIQFAGERCWDSSSSAAVRWQAALRERGVAAAASAEWGEQAFETLRRS